MSNSDNLVVDHDHDDDSNLSASSHSSLVDDNMRTASQSTSSHRTGDVTFPLPREHSYLSGASHLLYASTTARLDQETSPSNQKGISDLPILELQGVVLFPGSTLPVKLRDRALIQLLGHQIEVCRQVPHRQPQVRLGILAYDPSSASQTSYKYAGCIGTIATIQYTREHAPQNVVMEEDQGEGDHRSGDSSVWRRYQELDELVFTAVATGKFEMQKEVSTSPWVWTVKELLDIPLSRSPLRQPLSSGPFLNDTQSRKKTWSRKHDELAWNLATISHTPYLIYRKFWPARLVSEIITLLKEHEGGLNLPKLDPDRQGATVESPIAFSYYLAGNLPISQHERLDLLRMHSTLERLLVIRKTLREIIEESQLQCLGCARCEVPLSRLRDVFFIQGAEGTTSNYVNEHGFIHQVTTIRTVFDERFLLFQGEPCTENSYFPGFSWTITCCRRCFSLLGWKFRRVAPTDGATSTDCPDIFFGFQASSIVKVSLGPGAA